MSCPEATVVVVAKAPVPGRVKTRLCPPLDPVAAARVAGAALADTLDAVRDVAGVRRVLAMAGDPAGLVDTHGFDVVAQRGDGFGSRLHHAFVDAGHGRPTVLVGMDTPQLRPESVASALERLDDHDAALGVAPDGGWWLLALRDPDAAQALTDVPMSTARTGALTRKALQERGLSVGDHEQLRDVDTVDDAVEVAAAAPWTRFAAAIADALRSGPVPTR